MPPRLPSFPISISVAIHLGAFVQRTISNRPPYVMNVTPFGFSAWHRFWSGGVNLVAFLSTLSPFLTGRLQRAEHDG